MHTKKKLATKQHKIEFQLQDKAQLQNFSHNKKLPLLSYITMPFLDVTISSHFQFSILIFSCSCLACRQWKVVVPLTASRALYPDSFLCTMICIQKMNLLTRSTVSTMLYFTVKFQETWNDITWAWVQTLYTATLHNWVLSTIIVVLPSNLM